MHQMDFWRIGEVDRLLRCIAAIVRQRVQGARVAQRGRRGGTSRMLVKLVGDGCA